MDEAQKIQISCCCQVGDLNDKYNEFTVGPAVKAGAAIADGMKDDGGKAGASPTSPTAAQKGPEGGTWID